MAREQMEYCGGCPYYGKCEDGMKCPYNDNSDALPDEPGELVDDGTEREG